MSVDFIGLGVWEVDTPALVVDLDALEENIGRAASLFSGRGVGWRPHTKGQKVPAIAHMEMRAGAIGVTCAKLGEAEVMVAAGIESVLIGSQVVGRHKTRRLAALCRRARVITAVDSAENVGELDRAARDTGVRIPVVVEVDVGSGRCGVEPGEPALALSLHANGCPGLEYVGLMGWEGHARRVKDPVEREGVSREAVGRLVETARLLREHGLPVDIVSCGGTGTHEFSSLVDGVTEIQAGGIVFNDVYYRELGLCYRPALTVMSTVTSRPGPCRVVTDAGKKAMSADTAAPEPLGVGGVRSVRFSAEHGVIELEEPSPAPSVGDRVRWLVGYGDTTVVLHDDMLGVRGDRVETSWPVLARGKLR